MNDDKLRERLADLAHQQWSGWMEYLFGKCQLNEDGTMTIPSWAVERWRRQLQTHYSDLPEDEKVNDLAEADRVLAVFNERKTHDGDIAGPFDFDVSSELRGMVGRCGHLRMMELDGWVRPCSDCGDDAYDDKQISEAD